MGTLQRFILQVQPGRFRFISIYNITGDGPPPPVLQYYRVLANIVLAAIRVHKNRVSRRNKTVSRPE